MTATAPPAPLVSEEQVEQFETAGYVVVEDALSAEKVAQLREVIYRLETKLKDAPHRRDIHGLDIRPVITEDDIFLDLLEWPATFPLAVRFLAHFNIQLMTSHLIMVPPNPEKRNIGWHPDGGSPAIGLNGMRALGSLKVGYYLTDLLEPNMGALMVVPGSHRMQGGPVFPKGARDPIGALELQARAGTAVIFHQGLWHAGAPNYSNQTRISLYYGYGYRLLRPIDYEKLPQALLDKCSAIGKQLLGHKVTHLGYHIPREGDAPLKDWYIEHFGETWKR